MQGAVGLHDLAARPGQTVGVVSTFKAIGYAWLSRPVLRAVVFCTEDLQLVKGTAREEGPDARQGEEEARRCENREIDLLRTLLDSHLFGVTSTTSL